jgi:hypothetical protein
MVAMPDGTKKGIVLMDLDEFSEIASLIDDMEQRQDNGSLSS